MWEGLGQLEWKQGPNAFDYGLYKTFFQLNRIDLGDMQTKNPRNGTQNIHRSYMKNTQIYLVSAYNGQARGKRLEWTKNDLINSYLGMMTRQ